MSAANEHMFNGQDSRQRVSIRDLAVIVIATMVCALVLRMFVMEVYRIPSASMEDTLLTGDLIVVNKLSYGIRVPSSVPFFPISLVPRYLLSLSNIRRGDVIVFELPGVVENGAQTTRAAFVKRCIGVHGDSVEIRNSRIMVNNREMIPPATVRSSSFHRASVGQRLFPAGSGFTEWEYGPIHVPGAGDRISLRPENLASWKRLIEGEGHRVDMNEEAILIDGHARDEYILTKNYYFVLGDNQDNSTDSRMWGFVCEDDIIGEALLVYWSSSPTDEFTGRTIPFRDVRWQRVGLLIR